MLAGTFGLDLSLSKGLEFGVNQSLRSGLVVAGAVVVIALLFWAGVHNGRERRLAQQQMAPKMSMPEADRAGGDPAAGAGMTPALQGKVAPGFTLVDLDGKKVSLADYKGKPVLVNFWATWCGPCKIEMPWFQEFSQKYAGQGLVVLGLAADDASKTIIGGTARKLSVSYPILIADSKVEEAYGGVSYLPESFYVSKDGKILLETAGMSDDSGGKDEIEANIKKLIAAGGQ